MARRSMRGRRWSYDPKKGKEGKGQYTHKCPVRGTVWFDAVNRPIGESVVCPYCAESYNLLGDSFWLKPFPSE